MVNYTMEILNEDYAREICSWRYEGQYSVYNFSDWETVVENGWDLAVKANREAEFVAILLDNELIAYGRISVLKGRVMIGIGLRPSHCGKGYGKDIMNLLI